MVNVGNYTICMHPNGYETNRNSFKNNISKWISSSPPKTYIPMQDFSIKEQHIFQKGHMFLQIPGCQEKESL